MEKKERVLGPLTENTLAALRFLQGHDQEWVGADLADGSGIKGIHPVMNALVKRGLVTKGSVVRPFTNKKTGITADKEYVTYALTAAGRSFAE
jgi:hypothetical protein